jgi:hypothetical protein
MDRRITPRTKTALLAALVAALLVPAALARAGTQDFTLVNRTGIEIHELYISPVDTDDWEEDVLGVDTLPPGESVSISFKGHDACKWDLMVKDEDGDSVEWSGLNLCKISKVTLRYDGKKAWADLE